MRMTVRTNSETYARIIKGVERFGDEYRHQFNRVYYYIVSAKVADDNHVEFLLREV